MTSTYADVEELQDRLGIPLNDSRQAVLRRAVDGASRWIDRETGRRFYPTTETRYYSSRWHYSESINRLYGDYPWGNPERPFGGGTTAQTLPIDDFISVTAVATDDDGDGVYETTWTANTDYWLGPRNAAADGKPYRSINRNQVTGRYVFPPWENGVSVTGSSGYSTLVPDPIRELAFMVAEIFARPVLDLAVAGVQTYKIGIDLAVTMKPEDLPPMAQEILRSYRDPIFA